MGTQPSQNMRPKEKAKQQMNHKNKTEIHQICQENKYISIKAGKFQQRQSNEVNTTS